MKKFKFKPNTLVQYKGGGYDGCQWEWNYAYIDAKGLFHNIAATGRNGCDTLADLVAYYQDCKTDFDLYRFNKKSERIRFGKETPIAQLLGVARWFPLVKIPMNIPVACDKCDKTFDAVSMTGDDIHGIGGIAMDYGHIVCENCQEGE